MGFESSRESEFPPTLSSPLVGAISESRPTIICWQSTSPLDKNGHLVVGMEFRYRIP